MMLGLSAGLGLGLAGGLNLHRLVDLDHSAAWVQQTQTFLQSGFDAARQELASRINGLMSRPTSVAEVAEPKPWTAPSSNETVMRTLGDLSGHLDQVRAGFEVSARDLSQGIERIRSSVEENQRELVAKLAQLTERVERFEHPSTLAAAAPVSTQPVVTPTVVQPAPISPTPPSAPPKPMPKPVAKAVPHPAPDTKAKAAPKQASGEVKLGMDVRGIANWTVRDALDGKAILQGPRGSIKVGVGDTIPEIGRVQAIMRSGSRWVVATTKGVITPQ
jgi:hypothetical protein